MPKEQFIVDIVAAKQDADGNYIEPNISALTPEDVTYKGDPETGGAHIDKSAGETVEDGEFYAVLYDTINKRFVGQVKKMGGFTIPGEPNFNPKVDVTASGAVVSNNDSASDASPSASSESGASASAE